MSVFPDSHRIYVYLNDVRTNISDRVIGNITAGDWGMQEDKPGIRVGSTGWLAFTLNDYDGRFTPGAANVLAGWEKGVPCELEIVFEGNAYIYRFYINDIKPPASVQDIQTRVKAMDWFDFAAETPIQNPGIQLNQTGDGVLGSIINLMPIPPLNTDFDTGINIFPATLDTVTSKTKAYDEAVKVALSEIGLVYLHKDRVHGETLRFENARARSGLQALSQVPIAESESGFVLMAGAGFGGTDYVLTPQNEQIIMNELQPLGIAEIIDFDTNYGADQINHMTMIANPRRVDTSPQILFQLDNPIFIPAGAPSILRGTYADPDGGRPINANQDTMIPPVITTDYLVNTLEDGTGTDISASIEVRAHYGTEGFAHEVINYSIYDGYIIKFNCRGYGIYNYNPITHVATNLESIARYSAYTYTIDQKYKSDLIEGALFAESEVQREGTPYTKIKKILLCANVSPINMMAFLNGKIGDLFSVGFSRANISGYYYIHGMDDIVIGTGGMIMFKWVIKEALSLVALSLTMLAVEFMQTPANDGYVDFGTPTQIDGFVSKSFSMWVYYTTTPGTQSFMTRKSNYTGWEIWQGRGGVNGKPVFAQRFDGNGQWRTTNDVLSALMNSWVHIVITHDGSSASNDPIFYINGSSVSVTEFETPSGVIHPDVGNPLIIGNNWNTSTLTYQNGFKGKMKDTRIYNRILSPAEVSLLYNSGNQTGTDGLVTDGLQFQAFTIQAERLSNYVDVALDESLQVRDNIYGIVGTPHGSIYGRAP